MISGQARVSAKVVNDTPGAAHFLFETCGYTQKQVMDKLQGMKKDFSKWAFIHGSRSLTQSVNKKPCELCIFIWSFIQYLF